MTAVAHRKRAARGQGQLLREEIIAAAERLLIERGSEDAVSIRAIADAVGVTPPSIYMHFADKDELFMAVCEARFDELARLSTDAATGATDPVDELRRRGLAYVRFGLDNPEQYRVLFLGTNPNAVPVDEMAKWACLADLIDAIRRGMDEGLIVAGDPLLVANGLWAAVHGLVALLINNPGFPWGPLDRFIDHVLDMCVSGLAPRP
ncbi:MAG TPA: TetR/AcrR family transcriptional regulator [Acidimicrobiales bacterium]|nr:TetR/AcrR family transcriptional regulator [Acidimicrobiales bacterium]